jgi:glycosyltransferase involved in cell wall biosynthesis
MKVCLLNESFPPVLDGVANVLINYANYLQKDFGASVIVGTPRYPGADYNKYDYPVVPYKSFATDSFANGYRTGNPFDEKDVSRLADFAPDIIHSHCPATANIIARLLRDRVDAPIVFTYHTKYDIDLRRIFKNRHMADTTIQAMVSNIQCCDDVWVVSRGAGESLRAIGYEGDYLVMNNGVDFEKGRVSEAEVKAATAGWDLPEGLPVFLFVGRIITYKGIPMILDALKMLSDAGQEFRMVFIGKGPDLEAMQQKAAEYGFMEDNDIPGKCLFTGPIYDRNVLRAWNTRADLFIFPSTFDTNGLVVREAAACGLASVLIEGSCAAEDVTDDRNGFKIQENPESLFAFLLKACADMDHVHQVGQHAMDEIYLSWRDAVAAAYDRYGYVLEQHRAGAYAGRRKDVTDLMVAFTARSMEERDRSRQIWQAFYQDIQQNVGGMMDNVTENTTNFGALLTSMAEEWEYDTRKKAEKVAAAITENTQNLGALIDSIHDEVQYNARERKKRIKENIETASSAFQKGLEDFMGIDDGQK